MNCLMKWWRIHSFAENPDGSNTSPTGMYSSPPGCTEACNYIATWSHNKEANTVTFTIEARVTVGQWAAIGFSDDRFMVKWNVSSSEVTQNKTNCLYRCSSPHSTIYRSRPITVRLGLYLCYQSLGWLCRDATNILNLKAVYTVVT